MQCVLEHCERTWKEKSKERESVKWKKNRKKIKKWEKHGKRISQKSSNFVQCMSVCGTHNSYDGGSVRRVSQHKNNIRYSTHSNSTNNNCCELVDDHIVSEWTSLSLLFFFEDEEQQKNVALNYGTKLWNRILNDTAMSGHYKCNNKKKNT